MTATFSCGACGGSIVASCMPEAVITVKCPHCNEKTVCGPTPPGEDECEANLEEEEGDN